MAQINREHWAFQVPTKGQKEGEAVFRFPSVRAFIEECLGKKEPKDSDRYGRDGWYGDETRSFVWKSRENGRPDLVPAALAFLDKIERFRLLNIPAVSYDLDISGDYPSVSDFLMGDPEHMFARTETDQMLPGMNIHVQTVCSAGIPAADMAKRGLVIAAAIHAISIVRPINLWWSICGDAGYGSNAGNIIIKLPTQPIQLSIVVWALSSMRLTRDLGYNFLMSHAKFDGGWPWGTSSMKKNEEEYRRMMALTPDDIVIPPVFLTDPLIKTPEKWLAEVVSRYTKKEQSHV